MTTVFEPSLFSASSFPVIVRAPVFAVGVTEGVEDAVIVPDLASQAPSNKPAASSPPEKIFFRMFSSCTVNLPTGLIEPLAIVGGGRRISVLGGNKRGNY